MEILKLSKPVMIDGEEKTEISYDLEGLTGEDCQQATKELQKLSIVISTVELDTNYHAALFARAAGIAYTDMQRFSLKDYTKATTKVRDFFLADLAE